MATSVYSAIYPVATITLLLVFCTHQHLHPGIALVVGHPGVNIDTYLLETNMNLHPGVNPVIGHPGVHICIFVFCK